MFGLLSVHLRLNAAQADDTEAAFEAKHGDYLKLLFYDTTDISGGFNYQPKYERNGKKADATYDNGFAELDFGMPITSDSGFVTNLLYDRKTFQFDQDAFPGGAPVDTTVQSIALQAAVGSFLTDDLGAVFIFEPSINSDFEAFGGRDFQYLLGPTLSYRTAPNLAFQAGIFHSTTVFQKLFYPLLGVCYVSPEGWRVNIAFPAYARAGYYLTPKTELFALLSYSADEYHAKLGDERIGSRIRIDTSRLGVGIATRVNDATLLTLQLGPAFGTRYRLTPFHNEEFRGNLDSGFFLSAEIGFNVQ